MHSDLAVTTPQLFSQDMTPDMKHTKIYIQAAEQISIQQPLSEQWMVDPVFHEEPLVHAVNPVFRDYIPANEARRMGNIMKRALVTSLKVLNETGIKQPDAVMSGTSIGSLDYTERFLDSIIENGEETLSPTYFMQSTHNTVGSTIGIYTKTHGYNTTYSHGGLSFDLAVQDAWMQMELGRICTALVGGHDEMTEAYFSILQKTGYVGQEGMVPCGEVAMSMLLNTNPNIDALCELAGISICYHPSMDGLKNRTGKMLQQAGMTMEDVSAIMTGVNGNIINDEHYHEAIRALFPDKPLLHYKHLFGENYTVSALGIYAAAQCLKRGTVPSFVYDTSSPQLCDSLDSILLINLANHDEYSLILLKKK